MSSSNENLEKVLKIYMDKLKFSLGLDYRNTDYTVQLVDALASDFFVVAGETVNIKIRTERFLDAIAKNAFKDEPTPKNPELSKGFRIDIEKCLRVVPRMFNVLGNPPVAPALIFNKEKGKFKKVKEPVYEHKFEEEINYTYDHRVSAIHFKSGVIVREFGPDRETAKTKARSKIIRLLLDDTIFSRTEDAFLHVEPHEDIIFDIVLECKILTQDEITQLIETLKKEYLKDEAGP